MFNPKSLVTIAILLVSGLNFSRGVPVPPGIDRRTCQSNNDPHMVSFTNYPFEFQVDGSHCMAHSSLYKVQAQFQPCGGAVTCNCMVEVILPNGNYARIGNCGTGSIQINTIQTSSGSVTCNVVTNPLFNPFTESHWNIVSSGNSNFRCVQFNAKTYIKTVLPNSDDNLIVQVSGELSTVQVIVPPSYTPEQACLCDLTAGSSVKYMNHIEQKEIENFKNFEPCRNIVKPEKLRDVLEKDGSAELNERLDNFVKNCAIDAEMNRGIDLGKFQKNDARADICEEFLNLPVDQAADFLKLLGLPSDLTRRIQLGTENGFENCMKYIQNF